MATEVIDWANIPESKSQVITPKAPRRAQKIKERKNFGFIKYGYVNADGKKKVPEEYMVKITSIRNRCTIIAPLQEDISMQVESRWEPFVPMGMLSRANIIVEAVSGTFGTERRSLITRATSRRIWQGSSPLVLSFNLKFEAVQDAQYEVVYPGELLQTMALPADPATKVSYQELKGKGVLAAAKGVWDVVSKLPTLQPPGPNPFSLEDIINQHSYPEMSTEAIMDSAKGGDFIMVEVGRFLTFFNVIVRESTLNYKSKFTTDGNPVEAEARVVFETYEMMTVESLRDSYEKYTTTGRTSK